MIYDYKTDQNKVSYTAEDFIRLVRYEDVTGGTGTQRHPVQTAKEVIAKNLRTEQPRQMRVSIPATERTIAEENIYAAVVTQEYRRAGEVTITVPKHVTEVYDLRNMLEVTSDYLKLYSHGYEIPNGSVNEVPRMPLDYTSEGFDPTAASPLNFIWDIGQIEDNPVSDGIVPSSLGEGAHERIAAYRDILTLKGWRGFVSNITENGDNLSVTYTGELAGLSNIYTEPYITPNMDLFDFGSWLTDRHNEQVARRYKMLFGVAADYPCGDKVVRSSEGVTSIYEGLQKITRNGDAEPLILFSGTNRYLIVRQQPMVIDNTLTHMDILSASQGVNYDERFRKVILLGETPDTGTQPRGTYTQSDPDIAYKAKENMTLVDDYDAITPAYLATKAQERYEQQMVNSQSISIKLTAEAGKKVKLGGLYHIVYANAGIDGTYRLIKRTIDIFNPSENTHTFGAVNMLSQSDGVDGRYLSQDTIDGLY